MALDAPIAAENLPDLWHAAPPVDPDDAIIQQIIDEVVHANAKFSSVLIDAFADLQRFGWITAAFCGIGLFFTVWLGWAMLVTWWRGRREEHRLDRLACGLATLAWEELSPADLLVAEERWPKEFAIARFISERSPRGWEARTQAQLDEWFDQQREEARR